MFAFSLVSKQVLLLPHLSNDTSVNLPLGARGSPPGRLGHLLLGTRPALLGREYRSGQLGGAFVDHSPGMRAGFLGSCGGPECR